MLIFKRGEKYPEKVHEIQPQVSCLQALLLATSWMPTKQKIYRTPEQKVVLVELTIIAHVQVGSIV